MPVQEDQPGAATATRHPGDRYKWSVMVVVGSGVFMATLDGSIVNVSLPTLAREFGEDITVVQWVVLAYLVGLAGLMLSMGRLADIVGRKRTFLTGFIIFGVGSALCGLSPGVWWLVGARVVQAVGGAMLGANGAALVVAAFPARERGKAMGIIGTVVSIGLLTGPVVGGAIIATLGWPFIFLINVPIALAATIGGMRLLRESRGSPGEKFDFVGATLLAIWIIALIFALNHGRERGWLSPVISTAWVVAIAAFAAFIVAEIKARFPAVQMAVFQIKMFRSSLGIALLTFASLASVILLTPFLLQDLLGLPVAKVGLVMATIPAISGVLALIGGTIVDRFGARVPASLSLILVTGGMASMAFVDENTSALQVVLRLAVVGVGLGFFMPANSSTLMSSLPRAQLGLAGGFLAWSRTLGFATGQAIGGGRSSPGP